MNAKVKAVVTRVMEAWTRAARALTNEEYIEAGEEVQCQLEAATDATREEEEEK